MRRCDDTKRGVCGETKRGGACDEMNRGVCGETKRGVCDEKKGVCVFMRVDGVSKRMKVGEGGRGRGQRGFTFEIMRH